MTDQRPVGAPIVRMGCGDESKRSLSPLSEIVLFSVQDLFGYLRAHATMSGIQRVQAGIALYAISQTEDRIGFILNDLSEKYLDGEFLLIDSEAFREIILYASGEHVDHSRLRVMLDRCEANSVVIRPQAGNTIILLGAFWGHGNTMDRYVTAKCEGVTIGAYVYDIIPITHPEYCDEELSRDFSMSIGELNLVVDFVFTISDFTRHKLSELFERNGGRSIPMRTVPLAHFMTAHGSAQRWPASLARVKGRPYVAYVSTVEGRKNHLFVVNAWRQMIEEGVDVPDLVFVGRKGWRVNGLSDLLDGTHYLDGRVHIVRDLSDAGLNSVYANCLFTVFTSHVEGWGLPVGESLVHGIPCVASNTSSIPEVGGDFVDYVDPLNLRQAIVVLRRMIEDQNYRHDRRRRIETEFVPRSWDAVGKDFILKMREALKSNYPARQVIVFIPSGRKIELGEFASDRVRMNEYIPTPMRIAIVASFYRTEEWGAWMRGSSGAITFRTDLSEGDDVLVCCEIRTLPGSAGETLKLAIAHGQNVNSNFGSAAKLPRGDSLHQVIGRVGRDGICTVTFAVSGTIDAIPNDSRQLAIGLISIGYVKADDAEEREDLTERFVFSDMTPAERSSPSGQTESAAPNV